MKMTSNDFDLYFKCSYCEYEHGSQRLPDGSRKQVGVMKSHTISGLYGKKFCDGFCAIRFIVRLELRDLLGGSKITMNVDTGLSDSNDAEEE